MSIRNLQSCGLALRRLSVIAGTAPPPVVTDIRDLLWPTGTEAGMYIDPSYTAAAYQNSAGTTPLSAIGTVADSSNPVGLILDRKGGLVLGPDLVTNGDFSDGTGWTRQGNWAVSGGAANSGSPSSGLIFRGPITPVVQGAWYAVTVTSSGGASWVSAGGRYHVLTFYPGTQTQYVSGVAGGPYPWIGIEADNNTTIDNISVREIPGLHLSQSTSTARPLLSAKGGQTVAGDGTYSATGYPSYAKYDGIDDGMASATFAAGTLTSSMDCMIAVRRDSNALPTVAGLYQSDLAKYFGVVGGSSGDDAGSSGSAGSHTVWVDGVQLAGGTAVTRGTLFTALTLGTWHALEFRGLDLSTWTSAAFGGYANYSLNGANGGILLFESTDDATRNLARTWLAAKVGLTL